MVQVLLARLEGRGLDAVSYTHLDVYKRQVIIRAGWSWSMCYCPGWKAVVQVLLSGLEGRGLGVILAGRSWSRCYPGWKAVV